MKRSEIESYAVAIFGYTAVRRNDESEPMCGGRFAAVQNGSYEWFKSVDILEAAAASGGGALSKFYAMHPASTDAVCVVEGAGRLYFFVCADAAPNEQQMELARDFAQNTVGLSAAQMDEFVGYLTAETDMSRCFELISTGDTGHKFDSQAFWMAAVHKYGVRGTKQSAEIPRTK